MEDKPESNQKNVLEKILNNKGKFLIVFGVLLRIFMILYYYYAYSVDPSRDWGDIRINFDSGSWSIYPPISIFLLALFKFLSFGIIEIFAFWGFFLDLVIMIQFYFVIKSFDLPKRYRAYGLFFINPFLFLNNVFSLDNCGYHLTDSFFFLFLFAALYFLPKRGNLNKILFYAFLTLSAATKFYVLPALALFLLKNIVEKDWDEFEILLVSSIPILLVFLLFPFIFWEDYLEFYLFWNERGEKYFPLIIRLIPAILIFALFFVFRLKRASKLEILAISVIIMASFMVFSNPYIRYYQSLIFFGILHTKLFFSIEVNFKLFKRKILFDNHLLTFFLSFLAVLIAYIFILTIIQWFQ